MNLEHFDIAFQVVTPPVKLPRRRFLAFQKVSKLTRIFDNEKHTKELGCWAIRRWMAEVRACRLDGFDKFLATLEDRMDPITNYFFSCSSSGWVEGLTNKIKGLKRRSYGIKNLGQPVPAHLARSERR